MFCPLHPKHNLFLHRFVLVPHECNRYQQYDFEYSSFNNQAVHFNITLLSCSSSSISNISEC